MSAPPADAERAARHARRLALGAAYRCFVTVLPPVAAARSGPLAGVATAVKDCIDVAGVRGTWGSRLFADRVATGDAAVVAALRADGAELVATANLHEFAFGGTTQNPHFGFCRNAWNPGRVAGGSSGGTAVAVALGLCELGVGTDTGASVRLPASLNGVFGLRPTHGLVSSVGVMPVSPPHDTVGYVARDLDTLRRALASTARSDPHDPFSIAPSAAAGAPVATRVGVVAGLLDGCEPEIRDAFERAVDGWRARGVTVRTVASSDFVEVADRLASIVIADAASFHRARLVESPDSIGTLVKARIAAGLELAAVDYAASLRWLERYRATVRAVFGDVELLACPTVAVSPPELDDVADGVRATRALSRNCWLAPAAGLPALTVPIGIGRHGVPIGLQLVGPRHADLALLDFAARHGAASVPAAEAPAVLSDAAR